MNKRDAQRIVKRALKDGFAYATIWRWGTGWKVVLLGTNAPVGGITVYAYDEYEQEVAR